MERGAGRAVECVGAGATDILLLILDLPSAMRNSLFGQCSNILRNLSADKVAREAGITNDVRLAQLLSQMASSFGTPASVKLNCAVTLYNFSFKYLSPLMRMKETQEALVALADSSCETTQHVR